MMSGEARVGPCVSLTKPVMMEASSTKKHRPGIQRSRKALFISMLAPLSVVLNLMLEPQIEPTARHSALMYVHLYSSAKRWLRCSPCQSPPAVHAVASCHIVHGMCRHHVL